MKKAFYLIFCLYLSLIFLSSCGKIEFNGANEKREYEIRFMIDGEEYDKRNYDYSDGGCYVALPEPQRDGYEFEGWYYDEAFTTEIKSNYAIYIPLTENISVYGKSSIINYEIIYIDAADTVHGNPTHYNVENDTITLSNLTRDNYEFEGWYSENEKVTTIPKGSTGDLVLEAKWFADLVNNDYLREDNYIHFGEYPQTEVNDETIIASLTALGGTLPNNTNSQTWTSYEYYYGTGEEGTETNITDYMWYKDVAYNGKKYRGVYFTSYRPHYTFFSGEVDYNTSQNESGYKTANVYWFKFEPIKWRILSEENNEALLLCEMMIDSQPIYPHISDRTIGGKTIHANNWEYSTIRSWLNNTFYNKSFSTLQKEIIVKKTLDNTTTAIEGSSNAYATCQNNTEDKIYLLSYQDMLNANYGFSTSASTNDVARQKMPTDYAQAQGAWVSTEFVGKGQWVLRSPYTADDMISGMNIYGGVFGYCDLTNSYLSGTVPALTIKLR